MRNPDFSPHKHSSDVRPEDVQVIKHQAFRKLSKELDQSIGFMDSGKEEEEKKALAIYKSLDKQGYAGGNLCFAETWAGLLMCWALSGAALLDVPTGGICPQQVRLQP